MMTPAPSRADLEFHPVTPDRWWDLERLFGKRGASAGCWCMWWRLTASEFRERKGEGTRRAMKGLVESGEVPGILAYADGEPVGWCAVAPRDRLPRLDRSRVLKRVDDAPVWSIACFFVARPFRRTGLSERLLRAAVAYAEGQGAEIVEGYPIEPKKAPYPAMAAWTGFASAFRKAGFEEVARRSETRPIMRYVVAKK